MKKKKHKQIIEKNLVKKLKDAKETEKNRNNKIRIHKEVLTLT